MTSRLFRIFFSIVALTLLSAATAGPALANVSDDTMMVSVAKALPGKEARTVQAQVLIDAPPSFVWQTLTRYNELPAYMPGYKKSQVVSSQASNKILNIALKVARFLPTYNYQVKVSENPGAYQVKVNRISGDFKSMDASYKLQPRNGGKQTMLLYTLNIDTGLSGPSMNSILQNHTHESLAALQARSEASHKRSVIGQL